MNPVTAQAAISSAGESTRRAISAETMKMPEPIIEPITMVVALMGPSPFTNSVSLETAERGWVSVGKGCVGMSDFSYFTAARDNKLTERLRRCGEGYHTSRRAAGF